jgi:hypothetical protein
MKNKPIAFYYFLILRQIEYNRYWNVIFMNRVILFFEVWDFTTHTHTVGTQLNYRILAFSMSYN